MKITSLVENISRSDLKPVHGLSLLIEMDKHKILFDLGPDDTLFENCKARNIDIESIDIVIISHGHYDHGGALKKFLEINKKAIIYIQKSAFDKHYKNLISSKVDIGIDESLKNNNQIVLLDGDYKIDDNMILFTVKDRSKCYSMANDLLYDSQGKDKFIHEQNLIINKNNNESILIMGCGHCGVINIMERAVEISGDRRISLCVGGYHFLRLNPSDSNVSMLLDDVAENLQKYNTRFYTCHCTGEECYIYLSKKMKNISYLSCGESIENI